MGLMQDKVAVVTGAAEGIGRAVAELLAAEGASVVVADLGCAADGSGSSPEPAEAVARAIREGGGRAIACHASVTSREDVRRIMATAQEHFGGLDALLCCAGIQRDRGLANLREEDWREVVEVVLTGTFHCVQAAIEPLKARGGGAIVTTTGLAGLHGNFAQANLSAASAGVYGLTRTASVELQRHSIRVNAVAPLAKTRQTAELPMFEKIDSMTAAHVAPAYVMLASDLAREVTGQIVALAGGRMSTLKLSESPGRFKESDQGIWTAEELAAQLKSLQRP